MDKNFKTVIDKRKRDSSVVWMQARNTVGEGKAAWRTHVQEVAHPSECSRTLWTAARYETKETHSNRLHTHVAALRASTTTIFTWYFLGRTFDRATIDSERVTRPCRWTVNLKYRNNFRFLSFFSLLAILASIDGLYKNRLLYINLKKSNNWFNTGSIRLR